MPEREDVLIGAASARGREDTLIGAASARGRDVLSAAGCDTPRLDAELLLAAALGVSRQRIIFDSDRPLDAADQDRYERLLARRVAREPVAYILGHKGFRRLELCVDRRVLIPRPETELLVEVGLELAPRARVLDVGTGSGAVALALKDERPDLTVRGIDVDPGALEVACANRDRLGLEVGLERADLLDDDPHDAVLANLPYVPIGTVLAPEIARYEPPGALFAGADGLMAIRRLIDAVAGRRRPLPLLALEIGGTDQARPVQRLMHTAGFGRFDVRRDLAGHERVVVGRA